MSTLTRASSKTSVTRTWWSDCSRRKLMCISEFPNPFTGVLVAVWAVCKEREHQTGLRLFPHKELCDVFQDAP